MLEEAAMTEGNRGAGEHAKYMLQRSIAARRGVGGVRVGVCVGVRVGACVYVCVRVGVYVCRCVRVWV